MKTYFFIVVSLFWFYGISQTKKDILLTKTIPNLVSKNTSEAYQTAKEILLRLEEKNGPLPEHKFQLLSSSFTNGDIIFFKKELISLVENFGFDLILLDKRTNYYEAITTGSLSNWFRKKYPESRAKWLNNNFDKIPYIKELNDLYVKDQTLASISSTIRSQIRNGNKKTIDSLILNESKILFAELLDVCKKIGTYPSAKIFSLPQTPYFLVETHILKTPSISLDYLKQIYPYYKNAYLNNEIDYLVFRNYDIQMLMSSGKQYFGTIKKDEVPKTFLNKDGNIPIVDEDNLLERRKKLGWE